MKGRAIPAYPAERIAAARAIKETHGQAMLRARNNPRPLWSRVVFSPTLC